MANQIEVQVQGDFIERLISARPVQALAELIWNAFDGDADLVRITVEEGTLGISAIEISDNGDGFGVRRDSLEGFTIETSATNTSAASILAKIVSLILGAPDFANKQAREVGSHATERDASALSPSVVLLTGS